MNSKAYQINANSVCTLHTHTHAQKAHRPLIINMCGQAASFTSTTTAFNVKQQKYTYVIYSKRAGLNTQIKLNERATEMNEQQQIKSIDEEAKRRKKKHTEHNTNCKK